MSFISMLDHNIFSMAASASFRLMQSLRQCVTANRYSVILSDYVDESQKTAGMMMEGSRRDEGAESDTFSGIMPVRIAAPGRSEFRVTPVSESS